MRKLLSAVIILMFLLILIFPTEVFATDNLIKKANDFLKKGQKVENVINTNQLQTTSNYVYNLILAIGIGISVIVGAIIGIKIIMATTAEEKAKIKEMIIPYIVGCIILFAAFPIWRAFVKFGTDIEEETSKMFEYGKNQMKAKIDELIIEIPGDDINQFQALYTWYRSHIRPSTDEEYYESGLQAGLNEAKEEKGQVFYGKGLEYHRRYLGNTIQIRERS